MGRELLDYHRRSPGTLFDSCPPSLTCVRRPELILSLRGARCGVRSPCFLRQVHSFTRVLQPEMLVGSLPPVISCEWTVCQNSCCDKLTSMHSFSLSGCRRAMRASGGSFSMKRETSLIIIILRPKKPNGRALKVSLFPSTSSKSVPSRRAIYPCLMPKTHEHISVRSI